MFKEARPTYLRIAASEPGERPSTSWTLLHVNPLRTLYNLWILFDTFCLKFPLYALLYILPCLRPVRSWNWATCMLVVLSKSADRVRNAGMAWYRVDFDDVDQKRTFQPCKHATPVWIPKLLAPLTGEVGEMMNWTGDVSVRNSAWFYGKDHEKGHDGKGKIIYYLHGGGYCDFTATPSSPTIKPLTGLLRSNASTGLSKDQIPLRALALEYRLSHVASLPGIIADALAGWKFLIHDCGYAPENIVLAGDSAGAHLALALVRYLLNEYPFGSGLPSGLVLFSPWLDLSLSFYYAAWGQNPGRFDYPNSNLCEMVAGEVLRGMPPHASLSLYASAVSTARPYSGKEFLGFPPAILNCGEKEILIREQRSLANHYADAGSQIEVHIDKDACHDILTLPWFAFGKEQKATLERTTAWIRKLYA